MSIFTFILDFDGSTYIAQAKGRSPKIALKKWLKAVNVKEVHNLGETDRRALAESLVEHDPVNIGDFKNIWCATALVRGKLALINIVLTEEI